MHTTDLVKTQSDASYKLKSVEFLQKIVKRQHAQLLATRSEVTSLKKQLQDERQARKGTFND
jgi:hypothetical protein